MQDTLCGPHNLVKCIEWRTKGHRQITSHQHPTNCTALHLFAGYSLDAEVYAALELLLLTYLYLNRTLVVIKIILVI
jgi:hypothetical protein